MPTAGTAVITEHFFDSREGLFAALLGNTATLLRTAIAEKQAATLLVSGGTTPLPLYRKMAQLDLAWARVNVAPVDERWVESNREGSNEAVIRRELLQHRASAARFIGMKTAEETAQLAQARCEQSYQQLSRPFDLTILGMGPDGHTASLFPGAKGLARALDTSTGELCAAITAHPSDVTGEHTERMSLTVSALLQCRQLVLLITGQDKLSVYRRALASPDELLLPISAILHQDKCPVAVYWAP